MKKIPLAKPDITQKEIDYVTEVMQSGIPAALCALDNGDPTAWKEISFASQRPYVDIGGWRFDLRPYLREFWVKTKYHGILTFYAINKTAIRAVLKSECIKIVEV